MSGGAMGSSAARVRFSANLGFLWKQVPLPEAIRRASAAGFDAVECHQPFDSPAPEVASALAETGLRLISLNASGGDAEAGEFGLAAVPGREAEARASIDQAVEYAAAVGCGLVSVFAGRTGRTAEAEDVFRANLAYAGERAAAVNVGIVIEPLNTGMFDDYHLLHVATAAETVDAVDMANVGIMADTHHVMTMDGSLDAVTKHLPKVSHVQIAGWPDRGEPDTGIDFDRWLPDLIDRGYGAMFGAEYNPRVSVEDGLGWLAPWHQRRTQ